MMFLVFDVICGKDNRICLFCFQSKLGFKDWFKGHYNKTMRGIKYPATVTWKYGERGNDIVPMLVWKSNM